MKRRYRLLIAFVGLVSLLSEAKEQRTSLPLHIGGRVSIVKNQEGGDSYRYSWPGVYFEASFSGTSLDIDINDDQNILLVYIDGKLTSELVKPGKKTHSLKDLGEGTHRVRLEKRTETQSTFGTFEGFHIPSTQKALEVPANKRQIEFIGDSFTVGYGNTSPTRDCSNEDVFKTTNTSLAFGSITAKHFQADYQINASSGFGIVRNYNGTSPDKSLISLYPFTLNTSNEPYTGAWSPQIVVIGLGTNDFSTPLNGNEKWKTRQELQDDYVAHYAAFIKDLHKAHKDAHFILMASDANNMEIAQQVEKVARIIKAETAISIDLLPFTGLKFEGCHWHPSTTDDETLSKLLIGFIESRPTLWNDKK